MAVPSIHSYRFFDTDGEALLYRLDLEGVAASMGAACSSGALSPSHVMPAMGLSADAGRVALFPGTVHLAHGCGCVGRRAGPVVSPCRRQA